MRSNKYNILIKTGYFLCFVLVIVINFSPFIWSVLSSLKNSSEILVYPPKAFSQAITFEHYSKVLHGDFIAALKNSLLYSLISIATGIPIAVMAAYAISRCNFKLKKIIFFLIVAAIPLSTGSAALVIPNYLVFSKLGLTNKWFTLPLLYLAYNVPMATWVMIGALKGIPRSIDEAAMIDGASKKYIIFRLLPRLALPSVACAALFIFIGAWNEYNVSSIMVNSNTFYPIQVSIYNYIGAFEIDWGALLSASSLGVIPILIVFSLLGQMMVSGMTAGAIKE